MTKKRPTCESRLSKSKSFIKTKAYFLDLIDRKDFQDEIKKIRIKYCIPAKGFQKNEKHIVPNDGPRYPKRWENQIKEPFDQEFWLELFANENKIGEKFKIPSSSLDIIDDYVLYNETSLLEKDIPCLCKIQDCHDIGKFKIFDKENDTSFPILARISPYASKRDILEYIEIVYTDKIKPLQKIYRDENIKLGTIRSRSELVRKRNNFIFENRYLPLKKIKALLRENEMEILDEGHIGKIISLEKARRKEV